MTDTSKTDNPSGISGLANENNPPVPLETPEINSASVTDSFAQNNPGGVSNALEQAPLGAGDSGIALNSATPSVIIPGNNGRVPKWFYIVFILTLIVFITVTVLLARSFLGKSDNAIKVVPSIIPTETKTALSPSPSPQPTKEATDAGTLKISQVSGSDEIKDIENDIKTTDFSPIETGLSELDSELGFKTSP